MVYNKKNRVLLSFLISIIFVLTPICTLAAEIGSEVEIGGVSIKEELVEIAAKKIDLEVSKAFSEDEFIEVLVDLTEQVDTAKVDTKNFERVFTKNNVELTAFQKKVAKHYAVVDSLKSNAEETQRNIIKYLEIEKERGNVKEFKNFYIMNTVYVKANKEVIDNLSFYSEVKDIHVDRKFQIELPNVSEIKLNSDDNIAWGVKQVGAPEVWNEFGIDGSGVVVGVIDSGFQWDHEALKEKWRGYNPANPESPNPIGSWLDATGAGGELPYDDPSGPHGTHVTGTILGQAPDGENNIGVAPGAKWIGAKIFDHSGNTQVSWILAAGEWMLAPNGDPSLAPQVINNSWGGGPGLDEWFRPMVQAWRNAGILPVFSAGNSKTAESVPGSVSVPSNYPESFAVAATDIDNARGRFSRQGPGPYDEVKPDISAPGVNVYSSVIGGGYEGGWNGTSMAAPHVAGVAALLLSADASLTPDQLENLMVVTANPLTDEQYPEAPNYGYGAGLVNAYEAVSTISTGIGVVKGQVLKAGNDDVEPEIEHVGLNEAYELVDFSINAVVRDNVSVAQVDIIAKSNNSDDWEVFSANKISGNYLEGTYKGVIPSSFITIAGFKYKIKAVDFAGYEVETPVYEVEVKSNIKPGEYEIDFSSYPSGWIMEGDWEWGVPTVGPEVEEGNKLLGTKLHENYSNNSYSTLILPPVDLSSSEIASLRFDQWYDTESVNLDPIQIAVTTDGGRWWDIVAEYGGHDAQWREAVIDLQQYCGLEDPITIGIGFFSDETSTYPGLYIDNLKLVGEDTEAPEAPKELEASSNAVGVNLNWIASSDGDVSGYSVYRLTSTTSQAIQLIDERFSTDNIYHSTTTGQAIQLIGKTNSTSFTDRNIEYGQNYTYSVKAQDLYGNESNASNEVSVSVPAWNLIYLSDFEEDNGGFTTGGENNSWEWGIPAYKIPDNIELEKPKPVAFSGEKIWGTNIENGYYQNNTNSWIESPEIDLSGLTTAELNFFEWYSTENRYDKMYIKVSTDSGETWVDLVENYSGGSYPYEWELKTISLNDYVGQNIKLRFLLTSDSYGNYSGWHIDDVRVVGSTENIEITSLKDRKTVEIVQDENIKPVTKITGFNVNKEELVKDNLVENNEDNNETGLPLEAIVTVVETGKTVKTNSADGSFYLLHPAAEEGRDLTLRVQTYGYYPVEESIKLITNEELSKTFKLQLIPTASVKGVIVDERTGEPIEGAKVELVEDPKVQSVVVDSEGYFTLENVLEGDWTLRISYDDYHTKEILVNVVGNVDTEQNIELKPFISCENEIAYDDGTAESFKAFKSGTYAWAVKMTPEKQGKLMGANIYFTENGPSENGNEIKVGLASSDSKGRPEKEVFMTDVLTINRGEWNYIDLSEYNFNTDKDFYLIYYQPYIAAYSAGIGIDTSSPSAERTYYYINKEFDRVAEGYGNLMIRANMQYEFDLPVLNPLNETHTNEDTITVSGNVKADSIIKVFVNGEAVASGEAVNNEFAVETPLVEGENIITVTADAGDGETDPSESISIIKDTVLPELEVIDPIEGSIVNKEVVNVSGTVSDEYLKNVLVNDNLVDVQEDGSFSTKVIVQQGENTITVSVHDLAGNVVTEERNVVVNLNAPVIMDLKPDSDMLVRAGDEVKVSFRSALTGGKAEYKITKEFTLNNYSSTFNGIEMNEITPGYYEGIWVVPENVEFTNASVIVQLTDEAGNSSQETASGTITTTNNLSNSIEILDLEIKNQFGGTVVEAEIKNLDRMTQSPTLIIVVSDDENRVVNISTANISELLPGKSIILGSGFNTPEGGTYTVRALVWDDIENMESLAEPMEKTFVIE